MPVPPLGRVLSASSTDNSGDLLESVSDLIGLEASGRPHRAVDPVASATCDPGAHQPGGRGVRGFKPDDAGKGKARSDGRGRCKANQGPTTRRSPRNCGQHNRAHGDCDANLLGIVTQHDTSRRQDRKGGSKVPRHRSRFMGQSPGEAPMLSVTCTRLPVRDDRADRRGRNVAIGHARRLAAQPRRWLVRTTRDLSGGTATMGA